MIGSAFGNSLILSKRFRESWRLWKYFEVGRAEKTPPKCLSQVRPVAGSFSRSMPLQINDISIEKSLRRFFVLNGTQWGTGNSLVADGTVIREFEMHYADGSAATIPATHGENVRDWWNADNSKPTEFTALAWEGSNAASVERKATIRLDVTAWDNPYTDKVVRTIDYISVNTLAAPFCVAMTLE
jgi:hypothetical protein